MDRRRRGEIEKLWKKRVRRATKREHRAVLSSPPFFYTPVFFFRFFFQASRWSSSLTEQSWHISFGASATEWSFSCHVTLKLSTNHEMLTFSWPALLTLCWGLTAWPQSGEIERGIAASAARCGWSFNFVGSHQTTSAPTFFCCQHELPPTGFILRFHERGSLTNSPWIRYNLNMF